MAMVLGSAYWESDRKKRNEYNELLDDKKKKEKHESWLRELEAREEEEQELRRIRDKLIQQKVDEKRSRMTENDARQLEGQTKEMAGQNKGGLGAVRSVLEASERRRGGPILEAVAGLWQSRR